MTADIKLFWLLGEELKDENLLFVLAEMVNGLNMYSFLSSSHRLQSTLRFRNSPIQTYSNTLKVVSYDVATVAPGHTDRGGAAVRRCHWTL